MRRWLIIGASAVAFVGVGGAIVLGPAAPALVEALGDGRSVWRLGKVDLTDVSGSQLGDLRIARATLADADGVYAIAEDVHVTWRPFDLLWGQATIDTASASRVTLLRRPTLTAPEAPQGGMDISVAALAIPSIVLKQPVVGVDADLSLDGAVKTTGRQLSMLQARVVRRDFETDQLIARYGIDGKLEVRARSAKGGLLATVLETPDDVRLDLDASGSMAAGEGKLDAFVADRPWINGFWTWTGDKIAAQGRVHWDAMGATKGLEARLGDRASIDATLDAGALSVALVTPVLTARGEGRVREARLDGALRVTAQTSGLSRIAPEAGVRLGAAQFRGDLAEANGEWKISGDVAISDALIAGHTGSALGTVSVSIGAERIRFDADTRLTVQAGPAATLLTGARALAAGDFNRADNALSLSRAQVVNRVVDVRLSGRPNDLSGSWRVSDLRALSKELSGAASGRLSFERGRLQLDGVGERVVAPAPLAELLGTRPTLSATLQFAKGGAHVDIARLEGPKARFGAQGLIADHINLSIEATARGPVELGGLEISGALDATGAITGTLQAPTLTLTAASPELATPAGAVANAELMLTADREGGALTLNGDTRYGPLLVTSPLHFADGAITAPTVRAQLGDVTFDGAFALGARGPSLVGAVSGDIARFYPGLTGVVSGDFNANPDQIALSLGLVRARLGQTTAPAVSLTLNGPYANMAYTLQIRATTDGAPLRAEASGHASILPKSLRIAGAINGDAGGDVIKTVRPFDAVYSAGAFTASGALSWGAGVFDASVAARPGALDVAVEARDAPARPILALFGERGDGAVDGRLTLRSAGAGLTGSLHATTRGLTLARRAPDPLDVDLVAELTPQSGAATLTVRSRAGLSAAFDVEAPLQTRADPLRIALAGEGRVSWRVEGQAEALWAAVAPLDQQLTGAVRSQGEARFTANQIRGAGSLALENGTFQDRASGLMLRDVSAAVRLTESGATLESFSARDANGGRLTGTGEAAGAQSGQLALRLDNIRLLDRPDAMARASGPLDVAWTPAGVRVTGSLRILEAQASPPRASRARALLPVREVNRPDRLRRSAPIQGFALPATLDVAIAAPGKIFVRGRGLQSEWSLDVRAGGQARAPSLIGSAMLLRGDFSLAGRRFDVDTGRVRFVGPIEDSELDLSATRSSPDLTAQVRVKGTLADPDIALTSTPALPEEEILPQVVFGRAGADLSPIEAAQIAAGLAELSGQAAFDVAGAARSLVQLDRLDLRQSGGGFAVAGGKYLTREVYLELSRTSLGESEVQIEWRVRPQLFLVSRFGAEGDSRVAVRWRREE